MTVYVPNYDENNEGWSNGSATSGYYSYPEPETYEATPLSTVSSDDNNYLYDGAGGGPSNYRAGFKWKFYISEDVADISSIDLLVKHETSGANSAQSSFGIAIYDGTDWEISGGDQCVLESACSPSNVYIWDGELTLEADLSVSGQVIIDSPSKLTAQNGELKLG